MFHSIHVDPSDVGVVARFKAIRVEADDERKSARGGANFVLLAMLVVGCFKPRTSFDSFRCRGIFSIH